MPLHHSIIKKATRLGFAFASDTAPFRLQLPTGALSADEYDTTAEAFEAFEEGEVEFDLDDEEEEEQEAGGSVVKRPYHVAYSKNPHGPGCGDGLDVAMRDAVMVRPEGSKSEHVDLDLLREIGVVNHLWSDEWSRLNPGMQRMNLTNRLRAYLRNGEDRVIWLGSQGHGRFGVGFKPAKGKATKVAAPAIVETPKKGRAAARK